MRIQFFKLRVVQARAVQGKLAFSLEDWKNWKKIIHKHPAIV